MKKRFLSAALALAMMLTMLPMAAFAADKDPGVTATNYTTSAAQVTDKDGKVTDTGHDVGWYTKATVDRVVTYTKIEAVAISGTNAKATSGKVYTDLADAFKWNASVVLLADPGSTTAVEICKAGGTIDVNGYSLGNITFAEGIAGTLTIKDSGYTGTVNHGVGTITATTEKKGVTINATNVTLKDISLTTKAANTVKLSNSALTGDVTMDGDVDAKTSAKQTLEVTNSSISGTTTVTGLGSTVTVSGSLSDVKGVTIAAKTTGDEITSGTAPKVTVNGGNVGAITADASEKLKNAKYGVTVNKDSNATVDSITLKNATVKVDGGTVTGAIKLGVGDVTINNSTVGGISWGNDYTVNGTMDLTVTGANTVVTGTVEPKGTTVSLNKVNISAGNFAGTTKFDLGKYAGNGISGGTFKNSLYFGSTASPSWLSKTVTYEVNDTVKTTFTYLGSDFQALVNAYQAAGTKETNKEDAAYGTYSGVTVKYVSAQWAAQGDSHTSNMGTVQFFREDKDELVKVSGMAKSFIPAPTKVGSVSIAGWYYVDQNATPPVSKSFTTTIQMPAAGDTIEVYMNLPNSKNTDLVGVSGGIPDGNLPAGVTNQGIKAELVNGTIKLSGYIAADQNSLCLIPVTLKTTVDDYYVVVSYADNVKTFGVDPVVGSPLVWVDNGKLYYNGKDYPIDVTGLKLLASSQITVKDGTDTYPDDILGATSIGPVRATFSAGESASRANFASEMVKEGKLDVSKSPAFLAALNEAAGRLSQGTIDGYIKAAKTAAAKEWAKENNNGKNPTANEITEHGGGYNRVELWPFLNVTVSAYSSFGGSADGSMTMNIVPSYYIVVQGEEGTDKPYVAVANGTALGTMSGDYGEVAFTLGLPSKFAAESNSHLYAHHNGTYVYDQGGGTAPTKMEVTTYHGFSPYTINGDKYAITVEDTVKNVTRYYDSLQAAVDEVPDKGKVILSDNYGGAKTAKVDGTARTFEVDCGNNIQMELEFTGANSSTIRPTGSNNTYQVTLGANTVATTTDTVTVSVSAATGGTATTSTTSAKVGSTVTVTLTPSAGYKVNGLTVTTNSGTSVAVTATDATNHTYTFVVPTGATRVNVIPSFAVNSSLPFTDVKTTDSFYSAVAYCYQKGLIQGKTSTTFVPHGTITRAEIVTILWRQAGSPKQTATGLFSDMPGNTDMYNAVIWAYNEGIAKGYEDGKFYPNRSINRQELATFLYRYETLHLKKTATGSVNSLNGYGDYTYVGSWAQNEVRWAVGNKVLPMVTTSLQPTGDAPRYQAAMAMQQYCQNILGLK